MSLAGVGHRSLGDVCLLMSFPVPCWLSGNSNSLLLLKGLKSLSGIMLMDVKINGDFEVINDIRVHL